MASALHRSICFTVRVGVKRRNVRTNGLCPIDAWTRSFTSTRTLCAIRPFLLADIGEGITECQIVQWFVQPGARVEQFDKICEVQSDKASVEITSRFDGVIQKLHYEQDDVARVGRPLLDIDVDGDSAVDVVDVPESQDKHRQDSQRIPHSQTGKPIAKDEHSDPESILDDVAFARTSSLATPAVRRISKELGVSISDVKGTGKDGRVLKEDVQRAADNNQSQGHQQSSRPTSSTSAFPPEPPSADRTITLTPVQTAMFKTMTRSLSIPHLLYTDTVDFTALNTLRKKLNAQIAAVPSSAQGLTKLSALPFILKAISQALTQHPLLNAHLDTTSDPARPSITLKAAHNMGIAVDSPAGLVVPVVRNVQAHSVASLAAEIARLSSLAQAGKLSSADFQGASFTASNVGSIGGLVVAPVISAPQVAIVGIGRTRTVPAFDSDGSINIVRKDECVLSWSADHRVVDGATVARCAEAVRKNLEDVERMMLHMR